MSDEGSWGALKSIGEAAWTVLKDGKPSISGKAASFGAIPAKAEWTELTGARGGSSPVKIFTPGALWGNNVDIQATIHFQYGATFHGGGAYLPSITVEPTHVYVAWGFTVNLDVQMAGPWNAGTDRAPIAAVRATLTANISTLLRSDTLVVALEIHGDGSLTPG